MYDNDDKDILDSTNKIGETKEEGNMMQDNLHNQDFTTVQIANEELNFSNNETTGNEKAKKKPMGKKRLVASFVAVSIVASMLGGVTGGFLVSNNLNRALNESNTNYESIKNGSVQKVSIDLKDNIYFAAAVAEKSQKTVVGITTTVTKSYNMPYFGEQSSKGQSMGSGVIVDSNGYILTNSHVVGDGQYDTITVSLIDGTTEPGTVLWYDASLDLAVVKIDKTGLPAAELGNSDALIVGEPTVAIGNPMTLDLDRTVTQGIVSGLNRSITLQNGTTIKPLIQTDASINSGNSGGPLFNAEGKVIGINTAKMNSAEGLGFAIPINTATPILEQIINKGTVSSLYVGIKGVDIDTYQRSLGVDLSAEYGVVVIEAVKDSPAEQSGLKTGDIIISIDETKIEDMSDLKRQLYQYKENDKVKLTISRDNKEQTIEMTLKEKPTDY